MSKKLKNINDDDNIKKEEQKQNEISSDILSYNPRLEIRRKIDLAYDVQNQDTVDNAEDTVAIPNVPKRNYTQTLQDFISYKPSNQISSFIQSLNNIDVVKGNLKSELQGKDISNEYFGTADNDIKETVLEDNRNNISGSTKLEIYGELDKIYDEMSEVKRIFSTLLYGEDIEEGKSKEIDDTYINKMKALEDSNEGHKINYMSISYDTLVSCLMSEYLCRIDYIVQQYETLIEDVTKVEQQKKDSTYKTKINTSNGTLTMLENKFNSINDLMANDNFRDSKSKDNLSNSIYNMYMEKQDLNEYLKDLSNINNDEEYSLFHEIALDSYEKLEEGVENITKSVLSSEMAKQDIYDDIEKKNKIRPFFY